MIAALVGQQEEGLDKLELHTFMNLDRVQHFRAGMWHVFREHQDIFFPLVKARKEWKVHKVILFPMRQNGKFIWAEDSDWAALVRSEGTGHIGTLEFPIYKGRHRPHFSVPLLFIPQKSHGQAGSASTKGK